MEFCFSIEQKDCDDSNAKIISKTSSVQLQRDFCGRQSNTFSKQYDILSWEIEILNK